MAVVVAASAMSAKPPLTSIPAELQSKPLGDVISALRCVVG